MTTVHVTKPETTPTTSAAERTLPLQTQQLMTVAIAKIVPSPFNRKNLGDLTELTESVKTHGVLQPPTVRPIGSNGHTTYELVMGERRWRAAKAAGLESLAVFVRPLTDKQVLEVQLVENVQRVDIDPIEEAEGYERLHKDHGYSVDDLAAKLGKSKAYVYCRLKLVALTPASREALRAGKITASTALYVARVPEKLQKQALEAIILGDGADPMGARQAQHTIQRRFMLRLVDAPFDTKDPQLVAAAGACSSCPKRSGNQPELFADVEKKDTCTDPTCFDKKKNAGWEKTKAAAKANGQRVLEGKDAKSVFTYGSQVSASSGLRSLDEYDHNHRDAKGEPKQLRDLIGKKVDPKDIVLAKTSDGQVVELVDAGVAKALTPKRKDDGADARNAAENTRWAADLMQRNAERAAAGVAIGLVVAKVEKRDLDAKLWRVLVKNLIQEFGNPGEETLSRRGFLTEDVDYDVAEKRFDEAIEKMSAEQLRGLFVEVLIGGAYMAQGSALEQFCDLLKIERKQLVAKELARLKTEAKKPKAEAPSEPKKAAVGASTNKALKSAPKKKAAKK